jgi:hypothetical protein
MHLGLLACVLLVAITANCTFSVAPVDSPQVYSDSDLGIVPPRGDAAPNPLPSDLSSPTPTLIGSSTTAPTTVDLSADGALDWAHWGLLSVTDFDHKSGAGLISNYSLVGTNLVVGRYSNNHTAFDWSGGAPNATVKQSTTGIYLIGTNNAFLISAPADATEHTLQLYISVYRASGRLQVQLSDGSAADYTDTFTDPSGSNTWRLYTLRYRAASAGQNLVITWTQTASFDLSGNITLQAATLR